MKRIFFLILALISSLFSLQAQINVSIDLDDNIATARKEHYSTNIFGGNSLQYSNSSGYINTLKDWNPGFIRFHSANMNSCTSTQSWLDCETQSWDKNKIKDVLEEFIPFIASGDNVVITIYDYPKWRRTTKDALWYANWCAQLVNIVNVELGFNVKYWECMNEWDGDSKGKWNGDNGYTNLQMAEHYDACYDAMKAIDPNIKMMGPVSSWIGSGRTFLTNINKPLDVYSSHRYGGPAETDVKTLIDRSSKIADAVLLARELCDNNGHPNVPVYIGEWNIFGYWDSDGSENMKTKVGACFDALALKGIIERTSDANLLATSVWEDAGGRYSKIAGTNGGFNPGGHVFNLFSNYGVGNVLATTSNAEDVVQGFTVKGSDDVVMVAIMNRAVDGTKNVSIDFGDWVPENENNIKKFIINDAGLTESTVTFESISTSTFAIEESNVIVYVLGKAPITYASTFDGSFENESWIHGAFSGVVSSVSYINDATAPHGEKVTKIAVSTENKGWEAALNQKKIESLNFQDNTSYTVSFWARKDQANANNTLNVKRGIPYGYDASTDKIKTLYGSHTITTEWARYSYVLKLENYSELIDSKQMINFWLPNAGIYYIDAVTVEPLLTELSTFSIQGVGTQKVYPNPVTSHVSITGISDGPYHISIYNLQGRQITEFNGRSNGIVTLNVSNLNEGVYILKIDNEATNGIIKFVKK
jgi:xylan 1,4-beta-xylosidase